jgi:hypothetical protein
MRSRRIKKDANQNVERDEEASCAKKRLQKVHFSSHPLVDACDLGRPRFQRSSHSAELVPSRHTPAADLVAPLLATQTCHDAFHHSSCVAIRPADTPDCHRLSREPERGHVRPRRLDLRRLLRGRLAAAPRLIIRPEHVTRTMLIVVTAIALVTQVPLAITLETALHSSTTGLGPSIYTLTSRSAAKSVVVSA